jgi:hypothetical protein
MKPGSRTNIQFTGDRRVPERKLKKGPARTERTSARIHQIEVSFYEKIFGQPIRLVHRSRVVKIDTHHLSPEARERLETRIARLERHVIAQASLSAAQSNDDVVLPSQVDAAWNAIAGKHTDRRHIGIVITISAVFGGIIESFFGGIGKSIGEYLMHFFR